MPDDAPPINSEAYWSRRFQTDWISNNGRHQSIFFYRLIIDHLPRWLTRTICEEAWSICDWGCALGDGTDLLSQIFPGPVTGLDFAMPAIELAQTTFAKPTFLCVDLTKTAIESRYNVVVSSNTLEHFSHPFAILDRLQEIATDALVLLFPFREYARVDEHEATFDAQNIPAELGQGRLILCASKVVPTHNREPSYWQGEQILLTYVRPALMAERQLRLTDVAVEHESVSGEAAPASGLHDPGGEFRAFRLQLERADAERARRFADERDEWNARVANLADSLGRERVDRVTAQADRDASIARSADLSAKVEAAEARSADAQRREAELVAELRQAQLDFASRSAEQERRMAAEQQRIAERELASREIVASRDASGTGTPANEDEIAALQETVQARDRGIDWLRGEIHLLAEGYERRRTSFRILLADMIVLAARRWPWLQRIGRSLLPRRIKFRILARSNSTPLLELAKRTSAPRPPRDKPPQPGPSRASPPRPVRGDPGGLPDIVCFANIEWSARYQRPQQLMVQFARRGYRVFYIVASQIPPPGRPYDVRQAADGVLEISLDAAAQPDFYERAMTTANLSAYVAALDSLARDYRIKTALSVVHLSYWTPLAFALRDSRHWRVQYDCMDEWNNFPGIGVDLLWAEIDLVQRADFVTVTAALLLEKWRPKARRCILVRNGVDYEFFDRECRPNALLAHVTSPIIGYYGALAEWIDFALIADVARKRPDWSVVLIGDRFVDDLAGLDSLPNVHLLGRKPYEEMPGYLYWFDACLIPFRIYNVTHAVDPVKFYEYMSAGKPVVATPIAELMMYRDYIGSAADANATVREIEAAIGSGSSDIVRRRRDLARANDWGSRCEDTIAALRESYPKVSVVVVTFNNLELTRACIDSLVANTTHPTYEIIVVDNASSDGTRSYLEFLARSDRRITVELNPTNRGFAAACNQGLRTASGEILLLLNNDTVVPKGWVDPLVAHLRDPTVGLVGPVTNAIGNEARIEVAYEHIDDMEAFADENAWRHAGQSFDIGVLAMFCVAMRRDVFEAVGVLDEAYGTGLFEDDDYSRRVREHGLRTVCAEDAFVHHVGQASFGKLASHEYQALWDRNLARFEARWGRWQPHQQRPMNERKTASRH